MTCVPLLLLLATAALATGTAVGVRWPRAWLAATLVGTSALLGASLCVLFAGPDWEWRGAFALGGERLHLRLDGVSATFLALLSLVGGAGAAYSWEYWSDGHHPDSAPRGRAWWSALVLCLELVLTASNGLHFLLAWELFAVCAYFLITLDRASVQVRASGWLYLAASHAGTVFLFAFFAGLAARTGSWDLGPMRERTDLAWLLWPALLGFGVKAGLFPLQFWLPSAHANAPSHVSAILSGVAIKMGLYGLVRFSGWLPIPAGMGHVVLGLGAASAILGSAFALAQTDLKRLLAYCSVENVGIVLIGFGAALLAREDGAASWGRLALAGALLHVWNHGAFKSLLFFGAGSVLHATGTREVSRLGGLWRSMPWTTGLFAFGALAVSALPPLNGFVSEWLLGVGLLDAVAGGASSSAAAIVAVLALATAGALTLAGFVKAATLVFLGAPRTQSARNAHECGGWMRGPMLMLAAVCLLIGIVPVLVWPALSRAVGAWNAAWGSGAPPAPLLALGIAQAALACLAAAAVVLLCRRAAAGGLRRGATWGCGYAAPTARMQYTGGSFGGLATGWFGWIIRPERYVRRPRGPFPAEAVQQERLPDTVLERWIVPVARVVLRVSAAVRRLQHGRLQAYIGYIVVGLAALGAIVSFGSTP